MHSPFFTILIAKEKRPLFARAKPKRHLQRAIVSIAILTLFCLAGCATTIPDQGRKFAAENATKIEVGKTTEAEVVQLVGEPTMRTRNANGTTVLVYQHTQSSTSYNYFDALTGKMPEVKSQGQTLVVTIGPDGKVQDYNQSSMK
jgi:hypothetical protein